MAGVGEGADRQLPGGPVGQPVWLTLESPGSVRDLVSKNEVENERKALGIDLSPQSAHTGKYTVPTCVRMHMPNTETHTDTLSHERDPVLLRVRVCKCHSSHRTTTKPHIYWDPPELGS